MKIAPIVTRILAVVRRLWSRLATILANHADATWACEFFKAYDILFRQTYAFCIVQIGLRKVVYAATCFDPNQEWTAQ